MFNMVVGVSRSSSKVYRQWDDRIPAQRSGATRFMLDGYRLNDRESDLQKTASLMGFRRAFKDKGGRISWRAMCNSEEGEEGGHGFVGT